ncbi:MFS transporter [Spiroplasma endosymbiont of Dasysyrphus albostriatus]|uniref:MFS transporter n=1 Tax=Spiroplasma endosymbiont of Dasysyrphus albostriatus TaxID=3066299 RepID=UPI0030CD70DC
MKIFLSKCWKSFTHDLDNKTILIISILALSDLFVFSGVLYLRYIIPNFNQYINLNQDEFDFVVAIYGFVALISRIPGGWLTDRFSAKKIMIVSLIITGLCGLWWTLIIQLNMDKNIRMIQLYIIYTIWGISIAGLFWAPLWKLVSQNVTKEQQGVAYGLEGTVLGLFGLIFIAGIATGITILTKNLQNQYGQNDFITKIPFLVFAYFICGMVLIMSLLVWIFIPNKKREETEIIWKEKIISLFQPMKFLRVWLCGIFVFGMYMFQSTFAYYMKDALTEVGVTVGVVTILGGIRSYGLRFLVASPIGRWADKWKSYVLGLIFLLLVGMIACSLYVVIPGWGNAWFLQSSKAVQVLFQVIMCLLFMFIGCVGWALLTLRFVQVGELPMEKNSYASTISLISWIAFTPDAWFNYVASAIGKLPNNSYVVDGHRNYSLQGIQILLIIAIVCVLVGLIAGIIIYILNKRELKKLNKTSFRFRELGNV